MMIILRSQLNQFNEERQYPNSKPIVRVSFWYSILAITE